MAYTKLNLREVNQDFFDGLIKLHILYYAAEADVSDQELVEKLSKHGYNLELATVGRMLNELEQAKYLEINKRSIDHTLRDNYCASRKGRGVLRLSSRKIREMYNEFVQKIKDT
jgi:arginine repressor